MRESIQIDGIILNLVLQWTIGCTMADGRHFSSSSGFNRN